MTARQVHGIIRPKSPLNTLLRLLLFTILGLFALYYLMPLFVMIATALKPLEEIRTGTLISLPQEPTLEPALRAWDSACVGVRCEGLKPYVWNSMAMVIPAVIISTFLGAINGYALTKWRFRGSDLIFGLMLFGAFIPFQVVLLPIGAPRSASSAWPAPCPVSFWSTQSTVWPSRRCSSATSSSACQTAFVQAAKMDGAGFFGIFFRLMLPMAPPADRGHP